MIIKDIECYDGNLLHNRFAYRYFRNKVLPIGNIIAFRAPMLVEADGMIDEEDVLKNEFIYSDDAINFLWEIPGLNAFGAVAYQRLFNTQLANILHQYIKQIYSPTAFIVLFILNSTNPSKGEATTPTVT